MNFMSLAPPIYTTGLHTTSGAPGSGDARLGVPATAGAPPSGGSVWDQPADSSSGQAPVSVSQTPPIARLHTLQALMPFAAESLCNTVIFGPKGWDIVYDFQGRVRLACQYSCWPTHEARVVLREQLAFDGLLGASCKAAARSDREYAARHATQHGGRRVCPRTTSKATPML